MREAEAIRLREILLARGEISPLLNLGSSTRAFRQTAKPHIEAQLFGPLRDAGVAVIHSDLKQGDGVDVAGDVLDPAVAERLAAMTFRCVLLSNMLEHVADRAAVAAACERIVGPGGLILATVPSSFPYHADPIDTGYRPSPGELAGLFARSRPQFAEELAGPTYQEQIAERTSSVWREAGSTLLSVLTFPLHPKSTRSRLHRWRWLRRPYRVSIVLLEVGEASSAS